MTDRQDADVIGPISEDLVGGARSVSVKFQIEGRSRKHLVSALGKPTYGLKVGCRRDNASSCARIRLQCLRLRIPGRN
nr:hypothetical protein CFP56_79466 [Quercus suber]